MEDIPVINLLHDLPSDRPRPIPVSPWSVPSVPGAITLADLQNNYERIINGGSIHYPVAYQFIRELGRGRQGVVFLGLRQGARGCITEHAIKVHDPSLYRTPEEYWTDMGRIASQVSRLQRMHSPDLVSSHTYEETYGIGYVQMDAVDGIDLAHLLQPAHLDVARKRSTPREWYGFTHTIFQITPQGIRLQPGVAVHILRRVLRGLETLHSMRFLHTDVKPANIMIDRMGAAKVVDFGRAVTIGEKLTFLLGSPLYMAPETHRGEAYTPQSDLYSVGLVGLEMLCGVRLAGPEATPDQLLAIKLGVADRLRDLLPANVAANEALVAILRRLLDPNPARRYADAVEAEIGSAGLAVVHKQLVHAGLDSEYGRDLAAYLSKLVNEQTQRVDMIGSADAESSSAKPA